MCRHAVLIAVSLAAFLAFPAPEVHAQPFVEVPSGLPDLWGGAAEWGDVDGDGDLDVALQGFAGGDHAYLYQNEDGVFVDSGLAVVGRSRGRCTWFDLDRDGDLDLLYTGGDITTLFFNQGGTLVEVETDIPGFSNVGIDTGDLDGDGDEDVLILGIGSEGPRTRLYRNQGGTFVEETTAIPDLWRGSIDLADVDGDGDLDALVTGINSGVDLHTDLYRNVGGTFVPDGLPVSLYDGDGRLADLNGDGRPDLIVCGSEEGSTTVATHLFWNQGGDFVDSGQGLDGAGEGGFLALGDVDVDGDLDVVALGNQPGGSVLYRNDVGIFTLAETFVGFCCGSVALGDRDGDGDLDLLQTSLGGGTMLLRNDVPAANTAPAAPTDLIAEVAGAFVTLRWTSGTDLETPGPSLTHAVRVGTAPGTVDVIAPRSDPDSGARWVPDHGNAGWNRFRALGPLPPGTYHWSVQAVDAGYVGSSFAAEATFVIEGTVSVADAEPGAMGGTLRGAPRVTSPLRGPGHVRFELTRPAAVRLDVLDVLGRHRARLLDQRLPAGSHAAELDPTGWTPGVYQVRIRVDGADLTQAVVVLP
jgi:hypothetical protein